MQGIDQVSLQNKIDKCAGLLICYDVHCFNTETHG
jgi:hypothetical protein